MKTSRILFLSGTALLLSVFGLSCSSPKATAPQVNASSSSVSSSSVATSSSTGAVHHAEVTLPIGSSWLVDSMKATDTIYFRVAAVPGKTYRIQWDDSSDGTGTYSAFLKVMALDSIGANELWWVSGAQGYSNDFTVDSAAGSFLVQVNSRSKGSFAIRVFEYDPNASSVATSSSSVAASSLAVSSSVATSAGSSVATSSSSLSSAASSSAAVSSSSVTSSSSHSSSSIAGLPAHVGVLNVSRTWTFGLLSVGDTGVYTVTVTPNATYQLQWMKAYDYLTNELHGGSLPNAEAVVSMVNSNGKVLVSSSSSGSTPIAFTDSTGHLTIRVIPKTLYSTGTYYLRVFQFSNTVKPLTLGRTWTRDSLETGDTITYSLPVSASSTYRVQWADINNGFTGNTGNISVSAKDSAGNAQWSGSVYTDGFSYNNRITTGASTTRELVKAIGVSPGPFSIRTFVPNATNTLPADSAWHSDSLTAVDTVIYKVWVPKLGSANIQVDDAYGGSGTYTADTYWSWKTKSGTTWSSNVDNGYSGTAVTPGEDTILVRIVGYYTSNWGTVGLRVRRYAPKVVELPVGLTPLTDTMNSSNAILYRVPVTPGTQYRVEFSSYDDRPYASNLTLYQVSVNVLKKDLVTKYWVSDKVYGSSSVDTLTTTEDSLIVRFATNGYWGSFTIRVYPTSVMHKQDSAQVNVAKDISLLLPADSLVFKVPVTNGNGYVVSLIESGSTDITYNHFTNLGIFKSNGQSYNVSPSNYNVGTGKPIKATEDTLYMAIRTGGGPGAQLKVSSIPTIPIGATWTDESPLPGPWAFYLVNTTPGINASIRMNNATDGDGTKTAYNNIYTTTEMEDLAAIIGSGTSYSSYTNPIIQPLSATQDHFFLMVNGSSTVAQTYSLQVTQP